MNCTRRRLAALLTFVLLVGLLCGTALWLQAQQRQYALNRALIVALVRGDGRRALALVNAGSDPNTRYEATPVPSLPELVRQFFHRSPPHANNSPTALAIVCGAEWDDTYPTFNAQRHRPDDAPLVQAMLTHGATVNVKDEGGASPLIWAVYGSRPKTARLLLEHGASINAQDASGEAPLMYAVAPRADTDMVGLLLEQGANPNLADKSGDTPLMWAYQINRPDLVALFNQYGAKERGKRP